MSTPRRAVPHGIARRMRRWAAGGVVALAAGLATLLILGAPAHAADTVGVDINNLPSSVTPGVPSYFRVSLSLSDKSQQPVTNVHVVITVALAGAPADSVHVQKQFGSDLPHSGGGDSVKFTDSQATTVQNRASTLNYILLFSSNVPGGTANLTVEAYQDNNRLGATSKTTKVRAGSGGGQGPGQGPTTPANTNPGYVPTYAPAPTYSVAALPPADTVRISAKVPSSLYVLGGLLVAMGALLIFLLFRRQPAPSGPIGGPSGGPALRRPGWLRPPGFSEPGPTHERRPPNAWPR